MKNIGHNVIYALVLLLLSKTVTFKVLQIINHKSCIHNHAEIYIPNLWFIVEIVLLCIWLFYRYARERSLLMSINEQVWVLPFVSIENRKQAFTYIKKANKARLKPAFAFSTLKNSTVYSDVALASIDGRIFNHFSLFSFYWINESERVRLRYLDGFVNNAWNNMKVDI